MYTLSKQRGIIWLIIQNIKIECKQKNIIDIIKLINVHMKYT